MRRDGLHIAHNCAYTVDERDKSRRFPCNRTVTEEIIRAIYRLTIECIVIEAYLPVRLPESFFDSRGDQRS